MPCPHDNLPLLATGRLSGFAKWRAERHVKSCPDCTAELAQLSSLSGQLRTLTLSEPSADLDERVLTFRPEKKRQAPSAQPEKRSLRGFLLGLPIAVAALTFSATTLFLIPRISNEDRWISQLKIVWEAPPVNQKQEGRSLHLQLYALRNKPSVQSVWPSSDAQGRINSVELSHDIKVDKAVARRDFQTWIDRVDSEGTKRKGHGWSAQVTKEPYVGSVNSVYRRTRMLPTTLLYSAVIGLGIGSLLALLIWLGGLGTALAGTTLTFLQRRSDAKDRSKRRPRRSNISLRGFLLALPLVTAVLAICFSVPYIRQLSSGRSQPELAASMEIIWNSKLGLADSRRETLLTDINKLRTDRNTQSAFSSGSLHAPTTIVTLREHNSKTKKDHKNNLRLWMVKITKHGLSHPHLWTAKIVREPEIDDLSKMKWGLLLLISVVGFSFGGVISLTIWLLRMGGLPSVIPFVVIGFLGSWIFDTYQSASARKHEFHAEGVLIVHSEKTSLWTEDSVFHLSNSEEILKGLQDKQKQKIRVLKMERRIRPFSFRYSANGEYSNYSAGTVNLWMRRVQERLLKEWKEKERPSRVDEMNPPVQVIEAVNPTSVSLDAKKSSLALGVFLGLFLGGIYGYFYRPTRDRGRGASFPEA